jgi:uncharacterized protein (TIGR03437 family)
MKILHSRFLSLAGVLALAAASVSPAGAQTVTATRVLSNPDGPWFYVDGTPFYHAMSAFWPVGSVHTLWAPSGTGYAYNMDQTVQWRFQNWQWTGGSSALPMVQVIADTSVTEYAAVYTTLYKFTFNSTCNPAPCASYPGGALLAPDTGWNGTVYSNWQSPGSGVLLKAYANSGYVFAGWQVGNGPLITTPAYTATVNAPTVVHAVFVPAKTIRFATNPPNLSIYADRTVMNTPNSLQWGLGTSHTVGSVDVQQDIQNKRWAFSSWSDGGAATHTYVVGNNLTPETITANYAAAVYPFFTTSPPNLNLVIDGLTLPPPYSYIWGDGSIHTITAPTPQTDAQGNVWTFKSWDDLVTTPSRTLNIPLDADIHGFRLVALYTQQARLTINSTIGGQVVTVDGSPCTTPCTVVRNPGTQVHVSAPASVAVNSASRQDFLGWSTGGGAPVAGDWVATLSTPTAITATYHLMNSLSAAANPAGGATWKISPASPDGFYDSQTQVSVAVTARPGYRFNNWTGDLSGPAPSASLAMNVPRTVVAQLSAVPYIAPTGVSNGAGNAPQPGVAPGSVATIFGVSLATDTAIGPASPMVQTLAGVTVHIGARLMPLYFASPTQINLELPADLAPGTQTITVSSQGMPDITCDLPIVRDAPGLFPVLLDGQTYALVLHEDGTLVTATAPARQGELLTAYGTGFGPTDHVRPEGIAVPATPPYLILDPVKVQVGGAVFTPESAFAAPGQVGLDLVQFRLDSSAPSGVAIPVHVTVNGVNSGTLPLPIQ